VCLRCESFQLKWGFLREKRRKGIASIDRLDKLFQLLGESEVRRRNDVARVYRKLSGNLLHWKEQSRECPCSISARRAANDR
jgi:hypothetical protein